jgi:hypothetical protein
MVLLPVRDADARFFAIALKSTLRSRGVDFGVVVVDHGSDVPVVFADPRVQVLRVDRDLGFTAALEVGRAVITAAGCPFSARMDADDVMHPLRLAEDVAALRADATLAAVSSRAKVVPKASTLMRGYVGWQNSVLSDSQHQREAWIELPIINPATTFRAAVVEAVGGWTDRPWPEDYDLYLRMVTQGHRIIKRPVIRHSWRQHFGQQTRTVKARESRNALAACKAHHLVPFFSLRSRRVVVVGAGKEGRRVSRALAACGVAVAGFVDVDSKKIGRVVHGVPVEARVEARVEAAGADTFVGTFVGTFVVAAVGTSGARGAVRAVIEDAGYVEGVDFVVVA